MVPLCTSARSNDHHDCTTASCISRNKLCACCSKTCAAVQGIVPTLVMVVNPTVQYALYEWGCNLWRRRRGPALQRKALNSAEVFGISALAKLGATLLTYPLLVVKNRIQVRPGPWDLRLPCAPVLGTARSAGASVLVRFAQTGPRAEWHVRGSLRGAVGEGTLARLRKCRSVAVLAVVAAQEGRRPVQQHRVHSQQHSAQRGRAGLLRGPAHQGVAVRACGATPYALITSAVCGHARTAWPRRCAKRFSEARLVACIASRHGIKCAGLCRPP